MDKGFCDWCGAEFTEKYKYLRSWVRLYDRDEEKDTGAYMYSIGTERAEVCQKCLSQAKKLLKQLKQELEPQQSPPPPPEPVITIVPAPRPEECNCWLHRLAERLCLRKEGT